MLSLYPSLPTFWIVETSNCHLHCTEFGCFFCVLDEIFLDGVFKICMWSCFPDKLSWQSQISNMFFGYSLEETYHALRTFQILRVGETSEINRATCPVVLEKLKSPSSSPKGFFDALRVNSILGCQIGSDTLEVPP